jgi:beta-xylosidase
VAERRRRWPIALVLFALAVLVAAEVSDSVMRNQMQTEQQSLAAARAALTTAHQHAGAVQYVYGLQGGKLIGLQKSVTSTIVHIEAISGTLAATNKSAYIEGVDIGLLHTCLGGVNSALQQIDAGQNNAATTDISGVSAACLSAEGGGSGGPSYPFDFPDPFVLRVGSTYYAYATNSAEGNIQIIDSTNLTQWSAVGNALPRLPAWAKTGGTWAPSVLQDGAEFVLYYSAVVAGPGGGEECISAATSSSPTGPFIDTSSAPLECQSVLGGSIDPSPFVNANNVPYLVWKSNGAYGQPAQLWSQELDAAGTGFIGSAPSLLLTANQSWEAGVVEGPDMYLINGHYYLFFSGNNWNSTHYAVGAALCNGPLGPCPGEFGQPILSSGPSMSGPGGETVFTDSSGSLWMAFDAWLPGQVGYPHSRELFVRPVTFSGTTPMVAGAS